MGNIKKEKLSTLLKYPGGKDKELKYIIPRLPQKINDYYEPFVGGGAVYFAMDCDKYYINDKSVELMDLYRFVKQQDVEFLDKVSKISDNWNVLTDIVENHSEELLTYYKSFRIDTVSEIELRDLITEFLLINSEEFNGLLRRDFNIYIENFILELNKNILNKMKRMKKIEITKGLLSEEDVILNVESGIKSAFYMHFRFLFNNKEEYAVGDEFYTAIYFFIREFAYASMFRYNRSGKFNVPFGGISYSKKRLDSKISYFNDKNLIDHLTKTELFNLDFEDFLDNSDPKENDFIFLDPPYDTDFSTYANNTFGQEEQQRLANYLINKCKSNFLMIINSSDFINNLYPHGRKTANGKQLNVEQFGKKYQVSIQGRNNQDVTHLIIRNY